jgi:hypothetical protein
MTSPEELQQALDAIRWYISQHNESIELATMSTQSLRLEMKQLDDFNELFSAFKVEYDSQLHVPRFSICMSAEDYDRMVHVPRKQLESFKVMTGKDWAWYFYRELGYRLTDSREDEKALKKTMDGLLKELLEAEVLLLKRPSVEKENLTK